MTIKKGGEERRRDRGARREKRKSREGMEGEKEAYHIMFVLFLSINSTTDFQTRLLFLLDACSPLISVMEDPFVLNFIVCAGVL